MKKFLKHANRGLILSGIVLLIMIIYITVDYVKFSTQKDAIQKVTTDYISAVYTANLDIHSPSEAREIYPALLQEYFTENANDAFDLNLSSLKNVGSLMFESDADVFDITAADFHVLSSSISKSGTGLATVTLRYRGSFTGKGNSLLITPANVTYMNDYYDYGYNEYDISAEEDIYDKNYIFSYESEIQLSVMEENGQWKIASLTSYYYNSNFSEAETE